uniref:Dolichyl-diphosphooligosaccharide--protein glycosyltransferase subunit 1 n=1 Tax=Angiostrongylus cantonensis TaxID=6313 RepID=A0A0K0CXY1_ANGCA
MWVLFLLFVGITSASDWKVVNVERTVDISSQIVKVLSQLTLSNSGSTDANSVDIVISKKESGHLSYISAEELKNKIKLQILEQPKETHGYKIYKVELLNRIPKNSEVKLKIEYRLTGLLTPFPAKITQKENQFVVYHGDAHYASAYPVMNEKTIVKTGSGKTLSVTEVAPTNRENERVIYGPYKDQPAFRSEPIKIHYENNSPFVVATVVARWIEISHWGNIAVEEHIELVHKGAELKGPFSRLDQQLDRRGLRQPAMLYFTTVLPASAKDIYYRDVIGNISTSAVRPRSDSVDIDIKPRFPLFGGWRTSYVIGYNVPSFEYLYNKGHDYALRMRVLDHIFDNVVVENLTVKIILPEMVNLFQLFYEFDYANMIREPLIASAFFLALFTAVIIYMRFDFTIVPDPVRETRERIQGKVASLAHLVDKKNRLFSQFLDAVTHYKSTRDLSEIENGKKKLEAGRVDINNKLVSAIDALKVDCQKTFDKAQELLKYEKPIVDALEGYITSVQKSQQKSASSEDTQFSQKVTEARMRSESVLASL